jgi:hypothetical protein
MNKFSGEITPGLANLELNGNIRIIDLVVVLTSKEKVLVTEVNDTGRKTEDAFSAFCMGHQRPE